MEEKYSADETKSIRIGIISLIAIIIMVFMTISHNASIKKEGDGWHVDGIIVSEEEVETTVPLAPPTEETTTEKETTTVEETTTEKETTTVEVTTEESSEEEEITTNVPLAPVEPSTEPSSEELTDEEEEIITTNLPLAPVDPSADETSSEEDTTVQAEEEEEINVAIPFSDGQPKTGDSSNMATYIVLLLVAATGAAVFAYTKKVKTNE